MFFKNKAVDIQNLQLKEFKFKKEFKAGTLSEMNVIEYYFDSNVGLVSICDGWIKQAQEAFKKENNSISLAILNSGVGLETYTIETTDKLDQFDKEAIKAEVLARLENYLDFESDRIMNEAEYLGGVLSYEKAEDIIKYDIIHSFDKINNDCELISVEKEQEEQWEFEKKIIMDWAK